MTLEERKRTIELLNQIKRGDVSEDELKADYLVTDFLDYMKVCNCEPPIDLRGKKVVIIEPMKSFILELTENEG